MQQESITSIRSDLRARLDALAENRANGTLVGLREQIERIRREALAMGCFRPHNSPQR